MSTIISGFYPNGYDLTDGTLDPVTVTGTIDLGTSLDYAALQGETVAAWTVINQGTISGGRGGFGVLLEAGGTVTNAATAWIDGYSGVVIQGIGGTVVNGGTIDASSGAGAAGVLLTHGGSVTNQAGGQIFSGVDGITTKGGAGSVVNAGTISAGTNGAAIDLFAGGNATITATGSLSGNWGVAIENSSTGSVLNAGIISGGAQSGVFLTGGTVTNQAGGQISGNWGIGDVNAAGTVITGGTIIGTGGTAVTLPSGFANLLVVEPGAVFSGVADGGNAVGSATVSKLELASASSEGTLTGLGSQFVDFGQVTVDPGALWLLQGTNSLVAGSTLTDQGTLLLNGSTLSDAGSSFVTGSAGQSAAVTVDGTGAAWNGTGPLVVGAANGGSFTVANQGSASAGAQGSSAAVVLGASAGGEGWLNVTDAAFTADGELDVGQAGTGHLLVESQGTVQTGGNTVDPTQGLDIAQSAGASGNATVTGTNSLLSNTGRFVIGDSGLGSLSIQAGGTVITAPGTATLPAAAVIADTAGAGGSSVNVTGTASTWQIGGVLDVGNASFGELTVSQGATVTTAALDAGVLGGSAGVITVSGTNTALTTAGSLSVGGGGSGKLSILNGANVSIGGDFNIGQTAGGSGNVDIEDATGTVFVGGNLNLGAGGPAVLTVGPTSTLVVNGGINAGPNAELNLYTNIAPMFISSGTVNVQNSGTAVTQITQIYTAYVANTAFNLSQGVTYTLDTPVISGSASFSIGAGSTDTSSTELILNAGSVSSGSSISFTDTLGTLVLGIDQLATIDVPASGTGPFTAEANPSLGLPLIGGFSGTIKNFQAGDQIIVDTTVAATFSQSGSLVSVLANSSTLGVLTFDSTANATAAVTASALVDQVLPCFAAGTRIATERGEVAVEDLRVDDLLSTLIRDELAPVIWIGQRQVNCARHPRPRQVWPVRVLAGAFGPGRPHRDLFLSPDHAVYVNDVLIPVKHLINGSTIAQVPMDIVTYYHVELPRHDVILAEGLPAESYLDVDDRSNFDNGGTVVRMHPDFATRVWEAEGCAELVVTGPEFDIVRQMLAGWAEQRVTAAQRRSSFRPSAGASGGRSASWC